MTKQHIIAEIRRTAEGHGGVPLGRQRYKAETGIKESDSYAIADEENPAFVAGGFALMFPLLQRWERLFESFRTGRGVSYNELGPDR